MSRHLSPQDMADAIEDRLESGRRGHLDGCSVCQRKLTELREVVELAGMDGDVPEPSPLFWEHLERRVSERTASEAIPSPGWPVWVWRSLAVVTPALIVAMVATAVVRDAGVPSEPVVMPPVGVGDGSPSGTLVAVGDPGGWSDMLNVAAGLPVDEVRAAVAVRAGATDVLIDELSFNERAELLRLLQEAMEGGS